MCCSIIVSLLWLQLEHEAKKGLDNTRNWIGDRYTTA